MTSERERLLALRSKVDEQRRRFGGAGPFLLWWDDEVGIPDGADPERPAAMSPHADEIGKLVCPIRPIWSNGSRTKTEGTVFFDPADDLPMAIGAFRESANQLGCILESKHQQLRPLIVATYQAIKAKDWTLAWIFKRPFDEQTNGCDSDIVIPNAFGVMIECIDNELATLSRESPSPKPRAGNRIGEVWADFTISSSATLPRPTMRRPVKKLGRPLATDDQIKEACEVRIEYQQKKIGKKDFCDWWNGDKKGVRVGVKWLNAKLALVQKLLRESPDRIPKQFANKIKPLRRVKRAV